MVKDEFLAGVLAEVKAVIKDNPNNDRFRIIVYDKLNGVKTIRDIGEFAARNSPGYRPTFVQRNTKFAAFVKNWLEINRGYEIKVESCNSQDY